LNILSFYVLGRLQMQCENRDTKPHENNETGKNDIDD
jgi:hypothetical protein